MNSINDLEKELLNEIANSHPEIKNILNKHYSELRVLNRKKTGVGIYVNFEYNTSRLPLITKEYLSGKAQLLIPILKYPVSYEIVLNNGMISFMELVSNDASWNGNFDGFKLTL